MKRAVSIAFLMRVAGAGIWLLYTISMARLLPKADFGSLLYSINMALVIAPIATLGFETTTIKHASQYWANGKKDLFAGLLRQARRMAVLGGSIFLVLLLLGVVLRIQSPVTESFGSAALVGIAIIFASTMGIHRDTLRAADRIELAFLGFSITRTLLPLILSLLLAYAGLLSVRTAMIAFVVSLGTSLLIEHWAIGRLKLPASSHLTQEQIVKHRAVAAGTWLGDLAHVVMLRAPGMLVGLLTDLETLALFLAAERIANLGQFITDAVRNAVAPVISRACEEGKPLEETQAELTDISRLMLKSGLIDALVLLVVGWPALRIMGPQFTEAFPLVVLAIVVQVGWVVTGPVATVMNMIGLELIRTVWTVIFATLLCVGIFVFVSGPNVANALIVQAIAVWSLNVSNVIRIKRKTGVRLGLWAVVSHQKQESIKS